MQWLYEIGAGIAVVAGALAVIAFGVWAVMRWRSGRTLSGRIQRHFAPAAVARITTRQRHFPIHIRADLERAVDQFLQDATTCWFTGVRSEQNFGGVEFASLLDERMIQMTSVVATPPQYEQIDIGEDKPVETLMSGLWLAERGGAKFAVLFAPNTEFSGCGITRRLLVQVALVDDRSPAGATETPRASIAQQFFDHLEREVASARSYRGKVLSFEHDDSYSGQSTGVKVHRLGAVRRDEVILPPRTLDLLERNVIQFVQRRKQLAELRMATKKGLLFYGPPGTGKTHTIRYLACSLEGHTTLLISAEQVGLLGEYMTLARLLQPSLVVIEDADLIARERSRMQNPQSELLLNKLLNEMDGLREDCDVLFILTTNRPEELEAALASRPGRIDQAIEFPLPDAPGREKLIRLYARGLEVDDQVLTTLVARTEKVSASFIKELMRRAAQRHLVANDSRKLDLAAAEEALEEMLFTGGSLNLKLLGAEPRATDEAPSANG